MSLHKSELSTKDAEKGTSDDVHSVSDVGHLGVKTIQATQKVYGKYSKWFLFIGYAITYFSRPIFPVYHISYRLGLAAYIYSLDGTTTYSYLAFAVSSFGDHSLIQHHSGCAVDYWCVFKYLLCTWR